MFNVVHRIYKYLVDKVMVEVGTLCAARQDFS